MFPLAEGRIAPSAPGGRPVTWAATGRSGGASSPPYASLNLADHVGDDPAAVARNRGVLAMRLGLPALSTATMSAVHGAQVQVVDSAGTFGGVDALVTQRRGLVLLALGADCVPVALVGSDGAAVAAVHCGWRGLAADVVGAAASTMRDLGADVRAAILGPAICGSCYPVPEERSREVASCVSDEVASAALVRRPDGQPGIDVRAGLHARLAELGIVASAIIDVGGCTAEDSGLFSYRRDGITGRQGMAVCIDAMMDG